MFLGQHNVTVDTVSQLLWYLQRPTETSLKPVSNTERDVSNIQNPPNSQPEPRPPSIISIDRPRPSLFALIIGINEYPDPDIKNLKGAVADADSIRDFLLQDLDVPQEQIKNLRNAEATKLAIETEIRNLSSNPAIEENAPILIYYAGHGTEMPAGDLPARNKKIQMLVPYDFSCGFDGSEGEQGLGVLDVKLSYLLAELASKKGNNITCIFDSCCSGSGTRNDGKDPTFAVRSIKLPQSYTIPPSVFYSNLGTLRIFAIAKGSENTGLQSHVLLAACLPDQEAREEKQKEEEEEFIGAFTSALLTLLRKQGVDQLTYQEVIANLPEIPQQNPQCEGLHQDRILFDSKVPSPRRELYPVKRSVQKPGHFELQAGEAHGITTGAEFDIYSDKEMTSFIGSIRVCGTPSCFSALCTIKNEANSGPVLLEEGNFPESAYALKTRAGELKPLRVLIPLANDFIDVFRLIASDMQNGDNAILLVDNEDGQPDIVLVPSHPSPPSLPTVHFEIRSPLCRQHGLTRMPFDVVLDGFNSAKRIHQILRGAAHFYDHFNRSANSKSTERINEGTNIQMECFQLHQDKDFPGYEHIFLPDPEEKNLNIGGVITIDTDEEQNEDLDDLPAYGYKITNETGVNLYASLFYFDFSDLSIEPYFLPNTAKNGIIEMPLPSHNDLTIGYGSSGTPPFSYVLRKGQDVDIGALKLFLSTDYVDYRRIIQNSPFDKDYRGRKRMDTGLSKTSSWDTMTVAIVQRKKHV